MTGFHGLLTATVFVPAAGALIILAFVRGDRSVRYFAVVVGVADLVLSVLVFALFDRGAAATCSRANAASCFQFVDRFAWIPADTLKASYFLGVDGLNAPMVLLTGLLGLCAVLASWHINFRVREYFIWLLLLQTAVMGVFSSLDLLLFFLFWELELVPMFMLIATWGSGRKEYSAMKFLVFTILGSVLIIAGYLFFGSR